MTDINTGLENKKKDTDEIIECLSKLEIFEDFKNLNGKDKAFLEKVSSLLKAQTFQAGTAIIKENETGNSLYILVEGEVQILRTTPEGSPFAITNLKAEEHICFGETSLVEHGCHTSSVKAVTGCKALALSSDDFLNLCNKEPEQGCKMLYRLARLLSKSLCKTTKDSLTLYQALLDEVGTP